MLGTGVSMNSKQPYGKGWMDGDCYVVKNGVFGGAAAIAIVAGILILGFTFSLPPSSCTIDKSWYNRSSSR